MPESSLPSLDSNDGCASLDDVQRKCAFQSETNAIVNLGVKYIQGAQKLYRSRDSRLSATAHPEHHVVRGTRMGSIHGASGSDGQSAHCGSLEGSVPH